VSLTLILKRAFAALLFIAASGLLVHLIGDLNRIKTIKIDLAEIHHARYGILNADEWVARIAEIITKRVDAFELTDANRPQVTKAVAQVLDTMLVEIERYLHKRNLKHGGTWMDQLQGALQQGLQDVLIDFDRLREKVPQYADAVVEQLSKPEAKEEIKTQVIALMRQTSDATFAKTDRAPLQAVLDRYGCDGVEVCSQRLEGRITEYKLPIRQQLGGLAVLLLTLLFLCLTDGWRRASTAEAFSPDSTIGDRSPERHAPLTVRTRLELDSFRLLLLTGATLILLVGGILTPMIEIEASISELRLEFMGEPLIFSNQVLYFQTKSIVEVVRILADTGAADMLLVAVLLTLFSIIFPTIKLVSTYLYYYDWRGVRRSAWVRFFALRSGKWSMADVLVVAIFMAYIGFDGLVASQLKSLARAGESATAGPASSGANVLTTNGTALEPGFYLFLAFVFASLLLSAVLARHCNEHLD
jgi:hypothetical protein